MAEDVSCVDDKCARKLVLRARKLVPGLRHTEGLAVQFLFAYGMDRYKIEVRKHHYEITKLQLMKCCNIKCHTSCLRIRLVGSSSYCNDDNEM